MTCVANALSRTASLDLGSGESSDWKKWKMANRRSQQPTRLLKKIAKLEAEITELRDSLYGLNSDDLPLKYENLKTYRNEVIRGFILHSHLAIEDLLRALLFDFLVRHNRAIQTKAAISAVRDLRSVDLLHWCSQLKVTKPREYAALLELNRIRNACAHKWVLNLPKAKRSASRKRSTEVQASIVFFKGRNVFEQSVFSQFVDEYGGLYLRLLMKVWRVQGKL